MFDIAIIGSGPAGLTAAIYGARAGLKVAIFAGMQHGGQLTTTTEVENFPGFAHGIMGPQLMNDMTAQAERVGAELHYDEISKVDFSGKIHKLWKGKEEISAKTVIIATGATAKTLGHPGEAEIMGRGLSTCATCDGFFYKDKRVVVVGGGDSAMEEASYLAKICSEVILVHRRASFRASHIMLERVKSNPKIKMMIPYELDHFVSDASGLNAAVFRNTETGASEKIETTGLFYAIGHKPNSDLFRAFVDTDDHGYIKVHNYTETKTPGVFAAGDIADPVFKQAITAAGMGCQAALQAAKYIEHHGL